MRPLVLALALAAAGLAGPAGAHPMPNSTVVAQTAAASVVLEVLVPLTELSAALGGEPPPDAAGRYIAQHAGVTGADGRAWLPVLRDTQPRDADGHAVLAATLVFTPPAGGSAKPARLRYDAVSHRIASHHVLVYRREGGELRPLGRLQSPVTTLRLP